jgi:hypothetical protein
LRESGPRRTLQLDMRACVGCRAELDERFRFCPWCGVPLRLKIVDFFRPHPEICGDREKALRVSRYLGGEEDVRHVRFSVWHEGPGSIRADAAVSLDETETERLVRFLADPAPIPEEDTQLR